MIIRRLNECGILRFREYVESLKSGNPKEYPSELLEEGWASEKILPTTEIDLIPFSSRLQVGSYLDHRFQEISSEDLFQDTGLWTWLSLFYFNQVCPSDGRGKRKPGKTYRHILAPETHWHRYRHLLAGPCFIHRLFRNDPNQARVLLCKPLDTAGDLYEQLASRQQMVTNRGFIGAAAKLYFNSETKTLKRGAGGKGGGSPRRLADLFWQHDRTWDMYAMDTKQILDLLPTEFDRFKNS